MSVVVRVAKAVAVLMIATFFVALGAGGSVYLWQAIRLHYSWQVELAEARDQGRLTEDEYIARMRERSFTKALMSPAIVWKKVREKGALSLPR
jgi:hypothetical protein